MAVAHWSKVTAGKWHIVDLGAATAESYARTRKAIQRAHNLTKDKEMRSLLASMTRDCEYVEEWLTKGRRPGSKRGIERPYSTTESNVTEVRVWDQSWIEKRYESPNNWSAWSEVSDDEVERRRQRIEEAMCDLSKRERECYYLHHAMGMSEMDVARELNMTRRAVRTYLERAVGKIEYRKSNSLFLL